MGAVQKWAYTSVLVGSLLLFLVWLFGSLIEGRIELPRNPVLVPTAAFGLLVLLQVLLRTSAYPYASWQEWLKFLACGLVLFLLSACIRSREERRLVVGALLLVGFLAAFMGILQSFTVPGKVYWVIPVEGTPFGPYGNRNHFAGLMEMVIPMSFGLLLSGSVRREHHPFLIFLAVLMCSALILSGSRAGILAFVFELIFFAVLIVMVRLSDRWLPYVPIILLLFGGALYWLGLHPVLARVETLKGIGTDPSYQSRLATARDTLRMFQTHPIVGFGLGTYAEVFPAYNSQVDEGHWVHAHNDYVELLAETGLFGAACVGAFLWFLFRRGFQRVSHTSRGRSVISGALVGILGLLVHSLADFNLHIPANALVFFVLVSLVSAPES